MHCHALNHAFILNMKALNILNHKPLNPQILNPINISQEVNCETCVQVGTAGCPSFVRSKPNAVGLQKHVSVQTILNTYIYIHLHIHIHIHIHIVTIYIYIYIYIYSREAYVNLYDCRGTSGCIKRCVKMSDQTASDSEGFQLWLDPTSSAVGRYLNWGA